MTKMGLCGLNLGARSASVALLASHAEELGYDSLWFGEHLILPNPQVPPSPLPPETPTLDPLVAFGAVASVTNRIELATGILILPQRNPVVLAKQVATLDALSVGRFTLGLGVGYLESEMSAVGVPMAGRGRRSDEYLAAMRELWSQDDATFAGEFVSFSSIASFPHPSAKGGPRIVVGGHSSSAHHRALVSGHGWYGWRLTVDEAAQHVTELRGLADKATRPPVLDPLEIIVTPRGRFDQEKREALTNAGVDHIVLLVSSDLDVDETLEFIEQHAPRSNG